ncbi:MAG: endopeptidase La, partial [Candidatus Marinimicrobia bacterium]|nr:endopeptidase La [Candidatus Neomarinimicrobiota bacterium]
MNKEKNDMQDTTIDELAKEIGLSEVPILPLRNTVLFPQQGLQIRVGSDSALALVDEMPDDNQIIGVVSLSDNEAKKPTPENVYDHGTLAQVMKIFDMPDGGKSLVVKGIQRMKVTEWLSEDPYLKGQLELLESEYDTEDLEINAMESTLLSLYKELVELAPHLSNDELNMLNNIQNPGWVADLAVATLSVDSEKKQRVIEELNVLERLKYSVELMNEEIQRLEVGQKIQSEAQEEMSKTQRDYYLRQQLKAIQKELGEDEETNEIKEFEEKIDEMDMPDEAEKAARKELDRLNNISPSSPEYTVSMTYLDWLTSLPWDTSTDDTMDVKHAQEILDEDHYGLDDVKTRILEYLAVRQLKRDKNLDSKLKGPILCFVGPPGVGKTSIGKSIARAMGRKFERMSLGGVRDEAEIRGHRRTYIGALPGRIIQSIKNAGTNNPVIMLDEIDKMSASFQGDPSAALLEVLDPEQNDTFSDHYLEVPFDLSNVMFIATANLSDPIPPALKDRMELIDFSGYVEDEKLQIAKEYLVPKQM